MDALPENLDKFYWVPWLEMISIFNLYINILHQYRLTLIQNVSVTFFSLPATNQASQIQEVYKSSIIQIMGSLQFLVLNVIYFNKN